MKKLFLVASLFFCALVLPHFASAAQEFSTQYAITVTVADTGISHVEQQITITNLQSGTYAKEYTLTIASTNLQHITAANRQGKLDVQAKEENGKTFLTIPFPTKVIGQGKSTQLSLAYDVPDYLTTTQTTKSLTIPKIALSADITDYHLTITVPKKFGTPSFIYPSQASATANTLTQTWQFDKDAVAGQSVTVFFGDKQYYAFSISQTLVNPNLVPIDKTVTLPPQTPYQTVEIDTITPQPKSMTADADGNWVATFQVPRAKQQTVLVTGKIILTPKSQQIDQLSQDQIQTYLQPAMYWERDDAAITKISSQIIRPLPTNDPAAVQTKVQQIYDYVLTTLPYINIPTDEKSVTRLGAAKVVAQPQQAHAYEFADLFVALARAANIPARVTFGILIQPNQTQSDVAAYTMHVWPEYWTKTTGWQPLDPFLEAAGGNTNYSHVWDVRHIGLAIWASDSADPFPEYIKPTLAQTQQVVTFAETPPFTPSKPDVTLQVHIVSGTLAGFPGQGEVVIENHGKTALANANVIISSNAFQLFGTTHFPLAMLPPQGSQIYPFTFRSKSFFRLTESTIDVSVNNQIYHMPFATKPFAGRIKSLVYLPMVAGIIIGLLFFVLLKRRRRLAAQPAKKRVTKPS